MIGRHTPPPGRLTATASIPGAWCELLHTSHSELSAVIVITADGAMTCWWDYSSRYRARWAFWLLFIRKWPSDLPRRSRNRHSFHEAMKVLYRALSWGLEASPMASASGFPP